MVDLADLLRNLGTRFKNPEHLRAALVHRSYVAEHARCRPQREDGIPR